jgi:EAL domain-containing protein (putative c-di-GMP-specific phosphodiesterase class I)
VIAKGVEAREQGKVLLEMDCHLIQCQAIAQPIPASDIPAGIKKWRPDAPWKSEIRLNATFQ